jgi:hypothetical protein
MADAETCPEGYACNYCFAAPQLCPRGYYSNAGAAVCTLCEAGYMCPAPYGSERVACTTGYYAAEGSINCYPVPSHMTTSSVAVRPGWCALTTYSFLASNPQACTTCPVDQWCPSDNFAAYDCHDQVDVSGNKAYTSFAGENNCFAKTATRGGTNSVYTSAEFDTRVSPGYYAQIGGTHQYDCPNGKECLFPMENIFAQCPPGYYDVDGFFSCQPCPEGVVCPIMQHQYITNEPSSGNGIVQDGFFSPYGTHVELKIPAGWYTDNSNSKEIRPCPLGYYSGDGNVGDCTICPVGYNCPFGSNVPIRCNEGSAAASTGMHECTPCGDNEWYNPSTYACETKPDNYFALHPIFHVQACDYNQESSSTSFSNNNYVDCIPKDGYYWTGSAFAVCPQGFYCLDIGQATTYTKIPCPPGTY